MFFDRHAAGTRLAKELVQYKRDDVVLYALPKGGVPVGYEVAKALDLPLDIVIVQKICHPVSQDYGICAIAETGETVCYDSGLCGLEPSWLNYEMYLKQIETKRQREIYKNNRPSLSAENKIAILVDDGVSTGISMKAAIQSILEQWPEKIVVATPVAPHDVILELSALVDKVIVVNNDQNYRGTTSAYYMDFPEISDQEIIMLLAESGQRTVQPLHRMKTASDRISFNTNFVK
jgi:predicted phosphoribosyltransferase